MADVDDGQKWDEEELHGIGMVLLMAGHDATASMLGGILEWLSHDADLYARLRSDPSAFPRVFDEFLRFIPAGLAGSRTRIATDDIEVAGVLVRKGESVLPPSTLRTSMSRSFPTPHTSISTAARRARTWPSATARTVA